MMPTMNGLPPADEFFPEMVRAIRGKDEEATEVTNTMISNIESARRWFGGEKSSPWGSGPSVTDFIKSIVLSLGEIERITPLAIKRIFNVLEKHKQYKIQEELMGLLPGGANLVIVDGGDYGIRTQVDWRMIIMPRLHRITIESPKDRPSRVVQMIKDEKTPKFLRRVGAKALAQRADGTIHIYFEYADDAVLQKMMLSGI